MGLSLIASLYVYTDLSQLTVGSNRQTSYLGL